MNFNVFYIDHLRASAKYKFQDLNISFVSYQESSGITSLYFDLYPGGAIGNVSIDLFDDRGLVSLSFSLIYIPKSIAVSDFMPKSDFIYGGSKVTVLIRNIPSVLLCSNLTFYFSSVAPCISVQSDLSTDSATVTVLLPSSSQPTAVLPKILIQGLSESVPFPDEFQYTQPPLPTVQSIIPSSVSCLVPSDEWVSLSDFPVYTNPTEIMSWINFGDDAQVLAVYEVQNNPSLSGSTTVQDILFRVLVPPTSKAGQAVLKFYNQRFPAYFAEISINLINPTLPLLQSLTTVDTGDTSLGSSPLPVGSTSEHTIAIAVSNVPDSLPQSDWTIQCPFNSTVQYTSLLSGTATLIVNVHETSGANGVQYGIIGFSRFTPATCNASCCSALEVSCGENTKCGTDYIFACFAIDFFDDTTIQIKSIDNTQG